MLSRRRRDAAVGGPLNRRRHRKKDSFDKVLEVLGAPHPDVIGLMKEECNNRADSDIDFEAWNSGRNVTNPSKVHS